MAPGGELVAILLKVGGRDDIKRLVARIRIGMMHAGSIAGGRLGDAASPGGNGAGGIASPFGAERREIVVKARSLIGTDRGEDGGGGGKHRYKGRFQDRHGGNGLKFHG